jgi:uncharacterized damage-inducible protein DinB
MMLPYFQRMARYNQWANARLYNACTDLSDAERKQPRKAFFGSIHGTLNHIMVGDRIWLSRIVPWDAPVVIPLNSELYADFAELRREREKQDAYIIDYVNGLSEARIAGDVSYATTSGSPNVMMLGTILQHFFNHQTHHRGQAHDLLSQTPVAPPPLDLLYYVREVPEAA